MPRRAPSETRHIGELISIKKLFFLFNLKEINKGFRAERQRSTANMGIFDLCIYAKK